MRKALRKAQAVKIKNCNQFEKDWRDHLEQTNWPKSKSEYNAWVRTLQVGISSQSLKMYFRRRGLTEFRPQEKLWCLATCVG